MTPDQIKRTLAENGMTQRGAAKMLGINDRTMRRYIAGDQPVPRVVYFALLWVASAKR